jgi:hypothetical protein
LILSNAAGGALTHNIVTTSVVPGQVFVFTKTDSSANTVTLTVSGGAAFINGAASYVLQVQYDSVVLQLDASGSNFTIISANVANSATGLSWLKFTVSHTALQAAALTNDIALYSLPAGGNLHGVKMKASTAFAGTAISGYSCSVGLSGDTQRYASNFDVLAAVAATNFLISDVTDSRDNGSSVSIRIAAVSVGANLNQSTQGVVQVGLLLSACTLP